MWWSEKEFAGMFWIFGIVCAVIGVAGFKLLAFLFSHISINWK